jgi:hypothetical protein
VPTRIVRTLLIVAGAAQVAGAQPTVWARLDSARHLLPPAAFPALPPGVRADLARRGCRVPQAAGPDVSGALAARPNNVLHGAFTGRRARDWAVLCSVAGVSRILVYHAGRTARVDSLAARPDGGFLGREPGREWAYARVLSAVGAGYIRDHAAAYEGPAPPPRLDHQGIDDAFAGKASAVYYFHAGRWRTLQGAN